MNAGAISIGVLIGMLVAGLTHLIWPSMSVPIFAAFILCWILAGIRNMLSGFRVGDRPIPFCQALARDRGVGQSYRRVDWFDYAAMVTIRFLAGYFIAFAVSLLTGIVFPSVRSKVFLGTLAWTIIVNVGLIVRERTTLK